MNLFLAFALFIICIAVCLVLDISMLFPLAIGFVLFALLALKQGFSVKDVLKMASEGLKESFIVVSVMFLIGCLTGLWRASGTVAYFVVLGINIIPPSFFILAAFLLSAAMSYAIGTSFGVTATAGVILMSISHAAGISPVPVAGAVLSGVYVGDRGSPVSSSANLVAAVTDTDLNTNIRKMLKSGLIPFLICCLAYGALSLFYPMQNADAQVLHELAEEFNLTWPCLIPAVLMIILPFCNVPVKKAMIIDIAVSFILVLVIQNESFVGCLKAMVLGFEPDNPGLTEILSGGGIKSMLTVCGILLLSGTYGGIFHGTNMLSGLTSKLEELKSKLGRFLVVIILSFGVSMVFCNQTIGIIMLNQLSDGLYGKDVDEKYTKMCNIEDSVITISGLVPWCIACSVPLAMLDVNAACVPLAFYLWLVPICSLISEHRKTEKLKKP